jgi:ABC-type glutathione transport system ATPase component
MSLLRVTDVDVVLGRRRRASQILTTVSLSAERGEIVGIVGETGSGKTTLARTIVGLIDPVRGTVLVDGEPVSTLRGPARRVFRRTGQVQLVFQDPLRSIDPDLTIGQAVGEGLAVQGQLTPREIADRARQALVTVGLAPDLADRYPTQVSGGQRQRVAIARALVMRPSLLLCDEPVSALDASNRNRVLRLLDDLRRTLDIGIVVISHDLGSLAAVADRIVVLYRGQVVEDGATDEVFGTPRHPYTVRLVASAPTLSRQRPYAETEGTSHAHP